MGKVLPTPDKVAERWANNLSNAVDYIIEQASRAQWKVYAASDQAESNYKDAMQRVITEGRRKKGVEASNDETWRAGLQAARNIIPTAVRASSDKMQAVMSKLLPDIDNIRKTLPPRGPRGSDRNIMDRAVKLMRELNKNQGKYKVRGVPKKAT